MSNIIKKYLQVMVWLGGKVYTLSFIAVFSFVAMLFSFLKVAATKAPTKAYA